MTTRRAAPLFLAVLLAVIVVQIVTAPPAPGSHPGHHPEHHPTTDAGPPPRNASPQPPAGRTPMADTTERVAMYETALHAFASALATTPEHEPAQVVARRKGLPKTTRQVLIDGMTAAADLIAMERSGSAHVVDEGEHCQVCGDAYTTVYWLPDDLWAAITPKPDQAGAGLLCPSCAVTRMTAHFDGRGTDGDHP